LKLSKLVIAVIAVVIVVILAGGLVVGLGFITGKNRTATKTEFQTQTLLETETYVQPVTQTVLLTTSVTPATSTVTTTETSVTLAHTTLEIPTTVNETKVESSTATETSVSTVTTTASGYAVLFSGTNIVFTAGQSVATVPQQLRPGFNGYYEISYQTNASTPVRWVLQGNSVNETSFSAPSGGVDFPVQADVYYSILVYNDACIGFVCNNAFDVTATIVYEW
jgi:hypothetical protein